MRFESDASLELACGYSFLESARVSDQCWLNVSRYRDEVTVSVSGLNISTRLTLPPVAVLALSDALRRAAFAQAKQPIA